MIAVAPSKKVLVVEDEALVAFFVEDLLIGLGYQVVGPAASAEKALRLLQSAQVDIALLDVNLGGGRNSYAVADELFRSEIKFAFVTGYGKQGVSSAYCVPVLQKPFTEKSLSELLTQLTQ
ncbi:MAG: response regulator [Hyphomicrobium sp.]|nr:response regulator [Hyphomicrobium sp.]